jgi:anti-sigma factor RsiW
MTCYELAGLVTDYLEGALPARDRMRFEEHVATCRHCAAHVAQMRTTIRIVGKLREGRTVP